MSFNPCIVVPVYNHGAGSCTLAERIRPLEIPTIFVNDGSGEGCSELLRQLALSNNWIKLVEHKKNAGKGAAMISGLRVAQERGFTHALQIDADNQHDADDIPKFLALASQHPEAVVTGRPLYDETAPIVRKLARYLTHVWVWIETLSFTIADSMCGFRVYPVDAVLRLTSRGNIGQRMDFDTEILVRLFWAGRPVLTLPTNVTYPTEGMSNWRLFRDNYLMTRMHVRLVFGMISRALYLLYRRAKGRA